MKKIITFFKGFKSFFKGLKQKPSSIFLALLTIMLGVPLFQDWIKKHPIIYIIFLVLLAIVFLWDIQGQGDKILKKEEEIEKLTKEIDEANSYNEMLLQSLISIPNDFLELVFEELKFNPSERISLYTFRDNEFVIAGRYSNVKPLMTKGRPTYPEGEGYIGKAWKEPDSLDTYYKDNLPDYKSEMTEYIKVVKNETGMAQKVIKGLTMHSRCYYIKIVRSYNEPVGIIVLESLNPKFPKEKQEITDILIGMSGKHLAALIRVNEQANGVKNGEN